MSLRPCRSCGRIDPHRMIALMNHWFGRYAGIPPEGGYFYLCPKCHARLVDPWLEEIRHKLASEHPAVRPHELQHMLMAGHGPRDPGLRDVGLRDAGLRDAGVRDAGALGEDAAGKDAAGGDAAGEVGEVSP